jgi:hypothetical protein
MKTMVCLALPIFLVLTGCASISKTLSEDNTDDYDFRETRWGYSRQRVLLVEKDMQVYQRTDDVLVYRSKIAGVPAYLVYTFKDNKLRAAGYITEKPVKNAQNITKMCVSKHGQPTDKPKEGMLWKTPDTVIYTHAYPSHITLSNVKFERTNGGMLSNVVRNYSKLKSQSTNRWDSVWSYIDADFYNEQQSKSHFTDLSLYEKMLLGIIKRNENIHFTNNAGFSISISPEQIKLFGN